MKKRKRDKNESIRKVVAKNKKQKSECWQLSWALKERAGNNDGNTIPELENENDKKKRRQRERQIALPRRHTHTASQAIQSKARQSSK